MNKLLAAAFIVSLLPVNARADLVDIGWMTGCWAAVGQDPGSIEQWSGPAGGTMFGFNRVVRDGKTVAFEYLRIVDEGDAVFLIASPSGQKTAQFRLVHMTDSSVTFENPEHDFPQTITYRLDEDGNLVGRIEGTIDGALRAVDFPMTRTACDNGANVLKSFRQTAKSLRESP